MSIPETAAATAPPLRATRGSVMRAGGIYAVSSALANGMRFLLLPILARGLSQAAFGAYTIAIAIVGFGTMLATLGLDGAVARAWYDRRDTASFNRVLRRTLLAATVINAAWLFALYAVGGALLPALLPATSRELSGLLAYIAALVFVYPYVSVGTTALQAQMRPIAYGAAQAFRAVFVLSVVAVADWKFSVSTELVLGAECIAAAIAGTGALIAALAHRAPDSATYQPTEREINSVRRAFRYGLPIVPASLSNWTMAVSDRLVLARYVTPAAVAVYGLGYSLPALFGFVMTAANSAYVPHFFHYAPTDEREGRQLRVDSHLFAAGLGWVALAVGLLAPELVLLAGGSRYADSAVITRIVVYAFYVQGFYLLASLPIYYRHRTGYLPMAAAIAAAANVALNVALVPRYGIVAAAWNTLVAYGVLTAVVSLVSGRWYASRPVNRKTVLVASIVALLLVVSAGLSLPFRILILVVSGAAAWWRCSSLLERT